MHDEANRVFESALDLDWPWYVERVLLNPETREIVVYLDFEAGSTFTCTGCRNAGRKAYDTAEKRWRHLDFFGYRSFLQAPSPRVECPTCGVKQAALPWTRKHQMLTQEFEEFVVGLSREMPVRAVGRVVGEHDTRLWRVVNHYAK